MMAIFLSAVSVGNTFTAIVNQQIQVDGPDRKGSKVESSQDSKSQVTRLAGYDGKLNTFDDLLIGERTVESSVTELLSQTATNIEEYYNRNEKLPLKWQDLPKDSWGSQLNYQLVSAKEAKLTSNGPDKTSKTEWDLGLNIAVKEEPKNLQGTWCQRR